MKRLLGLAAALLVSGCVAHMTPYGVTLEPLLDVVIEAPVVVAPPPNIRIRPMPPVVLYPNRRVYTYNGFYYYYWGDAWYFRREPRGPWHPLRRDYWPPKIERRGEYRDDDNSSSEYRGRSGERKRR